MNELIKGNRVCLLRTVLILLIEERRSSHCGWHHSMIGILNSINRELSISIQADGSDCGHNLKATSNSCCLDFSTMMNHTPEL